MDKIEQLVELTLKACESWVRLDEGQLKFIDPIDKTEISAHYGATHAATAFILLGELKNDKKLLQKGIDLMDSIVQRWDHSKTLVGFHNDFNNFALCVAYDSLKEIDVKLAEIIKSKVCSTLDSNHNTINWLPMRWYVNLKRYDWTRDIKYQKVSNECKAIITKATNKDGGIEDVLPKGTSFNLQYDLATVAVLQFLNCRGTEFNLSKEINFLIKNTLPDGDINYQGRGTNQIFAWGMWLYILSTTNNTTELKKAISYLEDKVPVMLNNNNLMLNDYKGEEKYLWWDYHYTSVYTAHFLLWMVLALKDQNKKSIRLKDATLNDTGLQVLKTPNYVVSTFNGRKKYIAETGPIINAIWLKEYGTIFKGTFGPWQGLFGNKHTFGAVVLRNYFGLLKIENNRNWTKNRIIHKFWPTMKVNNFVKSTPVMVDFNIVESDKSLVINFNNSKNENLVLNLPILDTNRTKPKISLHINNKSILLHNTTKIKTQYGWCSIYQSKMFNDKDWFVTIE